MFPHPQTVYDVRRLQNADLLAEVARFRLADAGSVPSLRHRRSWPGVMLSRLGAAPGMIRRQVRRAAGWNRLAGRAAH